MTFQPSVAGAGKRVIPFGIDRFAPGDIRVARDRLGRTRIEAPFPCVIVDPSKRGPLRIWDCAAALFSATRRMADHEEPLIAIRDRLKMFCEPWNRAAWQFVDDYLGSVDLALTDNRKAIEVGAIGSDLFSYRDWIYAAPCPLPRAHILVPVRKDGAQSGEAPALSVDFLFWSGKQLVGVDAGQSRQLPGAELRRRPELEDAGVMMVDGSTSAATSQGTSLGSRVAAWFGDFWTGLPLPLGPFHSNELDALDTMLDA